MERKSGKTGSATVSSCLLVVRNENPRSPADAACGVMTSGVTLLELGEMADVPCEVSAKRPVVRNAAARAKAAIFVFIRMRGVSAFSPASGVPKRRSFASRCPAVIKQHPAHFRC